MKESMGALIKTPMTRTEACQILNIELDDKDAAGNGDEAENEPIDHKIVMERFDKLFEKNSAEKGGSFYIRSKIFFAKEHLMQDWPEELNVSKVMNTSEQEKSEDGKKGDAEDKNSSD